MQIDAEEFKRGFKDTFRKQAGVGDDLVTPSISGWKEGTKDVRGFHPIDYINKGVHGAVQGIVGHAAQEPAGQMEANTGVKFVRNAYGAPTDIDYGGSVQGMLGKAWDYTKQHPMQVGLGVGAGALGLYGGGMLLKHLMGGGEAQQQQPQQQFAPAYSGGPQYLPNSPQAIQKVSSAIGPVHPALAIPHSLASYMTGAGNEQFQTNKPKEPNPVNHNPMMQNSMTSDYIKHLLTAQQYPTN